MAWTAEQLTAINGRGKTILVSAAAGSGKTAVLVERVIRRLTDPDKSENITDFLIVTFTKAAAAEMRSRIAEAVGEALAQNPGSVHLRAQINLIHCAKIMTVHSFCLSLIKENFHALNISPDFRLMSDDEATSLTDEAFASFLEEEYKNAVAGGLFHELVESVCGPRDDKRLEEMVLEGYTAVMNRPMPEAFLRGMDAGCDLSEVTDAARTKWGRVYLDDVAARARYYASIYRGLIKKLEVDGSGLREKYLPGFMSECEALATLAIRAENGTWDEAKAALDAFFELPAVSRAPKGHDKELKEYVKQKREYVKNKVKELSVKVLAGNSDAVIADMRSGAPLKKEFHRLIAGFLNAYRRQKNEKGVLDFNDLEHCALRLLTREENGVLIPSDIAVEIGSEITELMVDEYQDTNGIQDEIFKALTASGASLFAVGDIKQSIYRFRGAEPGIFNYRKNAYLRAAPLALDGQTTQLGDDGVTVVLKNNFRSKKGILDGVNFVFKRLMSADFGELEYTPEEELAPRPNLDEAQDDICELDIIDMAAGGAEDSEPDSPFADEEDLPEDDEGSADDSLDIPKLELEARHIARRVKTLLESKRTVYDKEQGIEREIMPGDIAVLLRSKKDRASVIAAALGEAGIEVFTQTGGGFLGCAEVNAVFSLLAIIDNPIQDLYLIGALRSPLFGFSADELGEVRLCGTKSGSFYDALTQCAKKGNEEGLQTGVKCAAFLDKLSEIRLSTADMGVSGAVGAVIDGIGASAVFGAMDAGEQRRANLRFLFSLSADYEKRGGSSIGGFLKYLANAEKKGKMKEQNAQRGGMSGVRIMTIHHSKGLEFPVVILACTTNKINERWRAGSMLFHPEYGAGFYGRDSELHAEHTTLYREAVACALFNEQLSEELRALYVAMTRAREKLIITAAHKNAQKELSDLYNDGTPESVAAVCKRVKSLGGWIETALSGEDTAPFKVNNIRAERAETVSQKTNARQETPEDEREYEKIKKRLSYVYPHAAACLVPSKLTATVYRGIALREEDTPEPYIKKEGAISKTPKFMSSVKALTPSERGTAVHLAMQLLPVRDYKTPGEVSSEIEKLAARELLSIWQAPAVDPRYILNFYKTDTGRLICSLPPSRVKREFKFSILADAGEFFPELGGRGERLLLQGVIDLYFENDDGSLSVVDFKTDRIEPGEAQKRAMKYAPQLAVYKKALSEITGKTVSKTLLHFFETGETVTVDLT